MATTKELMDFINFLDNRGLLSISPEIYDYEKAIWEYENAVKLKEIAKSIHIKTNNQTINKPMKYLKKTTKEKREWVEDIIKKYPNPFLNSELSATMFQLIDADIYKMKKIEKKENNFKKTMREWEKCKFGGFEVTTSMIGIWRKRRYAKLLAKCKNALGRADYYTAEKVLKIVINHFSHKRNYKLPYLNVKKHIEN